MPVVTMTRAQYEEKKKQQEEREKQLKSMSIPLETKDGKQFGHISYDAYKAVEKNTLDSYKPKNEEERSTLSKYNDYLNNQMITIPISDKKTIKIKYGTAKAIDNFVNNDTKGNAYQRASRLDEMIYKMGLEEDELKNARSYAGIKKLSFSAPKKTDSKFVKEVTQPFAKAAGGFVKTATGLLRSGIKKAFGLDGEAYDEAWEFTDKYYTENPDELGNDLYGKQEYLDDISKDYIFDVGLDKALEYYDDTFAATKFISDYGFKTLGDMLGAAGAGAFFGVGEITGVAGNMIKGITAGTKIGNAMSKVAQISPKLKSVASSGTASKVINKGIDAVNKISVGKTLKFLNPVDNPTTLMMGVNSAQEKYNQLIKLGYDKKTAKANAIFTGYVNTVTEKMGFDGRPGSLFSVNGKIVLGDVTASATKNTMKTLGKYFSASVSEGLEEIYALMFERTGDLISRVGYVDENGQLKQRPVWGEEGIFDPVAMGESFLGGFVGGAVMSGAGLITQLYNSDIKTVRENADNIKKTTEKIKKDLIEAAESAGIAKITFPEEPDWKTASVEEIADYSKYMTNLYRRLMKTDKVDVHDTKVAENISKTLPDTPEITESYNQETPMPKTDTEETATQKKGLTGPSESQVVAVGDTFKDTNTGNAIKVVGRDADNTVVEFNVGVNSETRTYENSDFDAMVNDARYVRTSSSETQPVTSTKQENMHDSGENAVNSDVEQSLIDDVLLAMDATFKPGAMRAIMQDMEKKTGKADMGEFITRLIGFYRKNGEIGAPGGYFKDGGKAVVEAIEKAEANETTAGEDAKFSIDGLNSKDDNAENDTVSVDVSDRAKASGKSKDLIDKLIESIPLLAEDEVVYRATGDEFAVGEKKLSEQVYEYFDSLGGVVHRDNFGDVIIDDKGVDSSIAHGMGRAKAIAFSSVPAVIEKGRQIDFQKKWKGRNYDSYVFAAPIQIGEQRAYTAVVVTKSEQDNRYYLHEVTDDKGNIIVIKKDDASFKSKSETNESPLGETSPSNAILSQDNNNVNMNDHTNPIESEENENGRDDLLHGSSERSGDESAGKQTGQLSKAERKNQGKAKAERKSTATELLAKGQTEKEIISVSRSGKKSRLQLNVIKSENYTEDMISLVEEYKERGIDVKLFVGNGIMAFDTARDFPVNGIAVGNSQIYLRYDGEFAPETLGEHELVHIEWTSERVQAAKNGIMESLSEEEKKEILEQERYADYLELYDGDEDAVWQEFIADVLAGMNEYTETYREIVESYRNGENDIIERYKVEEYSGSIDAGGVYDYTKSFAQQIDDWKKGLIPVNDSLLVGATPEVFKEIGFNALPVTINQTHVNYAVNGTKDTDHYLGEALLQQLPQALENPVAVIKSQTQPGRVVAILKMQHNGKNVVVPIEIDGYGRQNNVRIDSNAIASVFGKGNAITKLLSDALNDESNGNISVFYWDKKEALSLLQTPGLQLPNHLPQGLSLLQRAGLQLPSGLPQDGFVHSIREKGANVNIKFENVTESQQFKRWFGDSKVVNEDGTPKVMYRGDDNMDFTVFDRKKSRASNLYGRGFYFTESESAARTYGKTHSFYLKVDTPLTPGEHKITKEQLKRFLEAVAENEDDYDIWNYGTTDIDEIADSLYGKGDFEMLQDISATAVGDMVETVELFNSVNGTKYDGIVTETETIVFDSTQIKSATDNIGTFDGDNPDIRFSTSSEEFDFTTQDLLVSLFKDEGYSEQMVEVAKKNKREFSELIKTNKNLAKRLDNAVRQMTISKAPRVNRVNVAKALKRILKDMNSTLKAEDISEEVISIYDDYYAEVKKAGRVTSKLEEAAEKMYSRFLDVASKIVKSAEVYVEEDDYVELKALLSETNISVRPEDKAELDYANFRKRNMKKINLTNDGVPMESFYKELCELFPYLFDASIYNVPDQLKAVEDVLARLKPEAQNPYAGFVEDAIDYVVERFISEGDGISAMPKTKAEKMAEKSRADKEKAISNLEEKFKKRQERYQEEMEEKIYRLRDRINNLKLEKLDIYKSKQDAIKKIRDNRKKAILKASIRKIADRMTQGLKKSEKSGGYPKELVHAIAEVCSMLDFRTDVLTNRYGEPSKTRMRLDALQVQYEALQNNPDFDIASEYSKTIQGKIAALNAVAGGKRINDLSIEWLSALKDILTSIEHHIANAKKQIGIENALSNREIGMRIYNDIEQMSPPKLSAYMSQVLNPMRVAEMVANYDENSEFYKLMKQVNDGTHKKDWFDMVARKPFDALMNGGGNEVQMYDFLTRTYDTGIKYLDGSPVLLPKNMICEIILLWERKQGRKHLENGGATIPELRKFNKGKIADAFAGGKQTKGLKEADIYRLRGMLDSYDVQWMKEARKLFRKVSKNAINETSMQLDGRPLANDSEYITIHVDSDFLHSNIDGLKVDSTIEGWGSLKEVNKNATQPLSIAGLSYTVDEHIESVGRYYGLAVPIRNWNKVYGVSFTQRTNGANGNSADEGSDPYSVRKIIGQKFGKDIKNGVLEQAIRDLQSSRKGADGWFSRIATKTRSNWIGATFTFNINIPLKQLTSYVTASAVLGTKAIGKAVPYFGKISPLISEIDKHTGIFYKARRGYSTQELGDRANQKIFTGLKTALMKKTGVYKLTDKMPEGILPGNWIQSVDCRVRAVLWAATKYYVQDELGIKEDSKNYWDEVTKKYHEVIEKTQSNYDILHKPEVLKTTDEITKTLFMFTNDVFQQSGILVSGYGSWKAADKMYKDAMKEEKLAQQKYEKEKNAETESRLKQATEIRQSAENRRNNSIGTFKSALVAILLSSLTIELLTGVGRVVLRKLKPYKDEENNEVNAQSVTKEIGMGFASNIFATAVPGIGALLKSAAETFMYGYEFASVPTFDIVQDVLSGLKSAYDVFDTYCIKKPYLPEEERNEKMKKATSDVSKAVCYCFGFPLKNIEDLYKAGAGYVGDIKEGELFHNMDEIISDSRRVYTNADLAASIATGNHSEEKKIFDYFKNNGYEISKAALTKEIKQAYLAYYEDEPEKAEAIKERLIQAYGYKKSDFRKWIDDYENPKEDEDEEQEELEWVDYSD